MKLKQAWLKRLHRQINCVLSLKTKILDFTQNKANLGFHKLYYMALEKNALEYLNKNVKNKTITIKNYKKTINSDYYADVYVEGQNLANVLLQNGLGIINPNNNKKYTYS